MKCSVLVLLAVAAAAAASLASSLSHHGRQHHHHRSNERRRRHPREGFIKQLFFLWGGGELGGNIARFFVGRKVFVKASISQTVDSTISEEKGDECPRSERPPTLHTHTTRPNTQQIKRGALIITD